MGLTEFFFYVFATVAVLSATMVIIARNPVHAVLFLILTFFNAAGLFVLMGAEFRRCCSSSFTSALSQYCFCSL